MRSLAIELSEGPDWEWVFGMLGVMGRVENLEIRDGWTQMLQFWCGDRKWERLCPALRQLTVYGGECAGPDLAAFEDSRRGVGLPLTVTHFLRDEGH